MVREEGKTMKEALELARADPETRSLRFTTPLAVEAKGDNKRKNDQTSLWSDNRPNKLMKGNGKKGKDKGKEANRGEDPERLLNFWDGKQICYKYNNGSCDDPNCTRLHCCQRRGCRGEKHSLAKCKKYAGKGQGKKGKKQR